MMGNAEHTIRNDIYFSGRFHIKYSYFLVKLLTSDLESP
jgi:hypothetical protein